MLMNPLARRNKTILSFYCCLFLILFLQFGCKINAHDTDPEAKSIFSSAPSAAKIKEKNFRLSISHGGGFTGLIKGYHLYADGHMEFWEKYPGKEEIIKHKYMVAPDKIQSFHEQLLQLDLLGTVIQEKGNMTTYVIYEEDEQVYSWSWANSMGRLGNLPTELKNWYVAVKKFCDIENKSDY